MLYVYQALNPDGSAFQGRAEFESVQNLMDELSSRDQILVTYRTKRFDFTDLLEDLTKPGLTRLDFADLCDSLSSMVGSGLPLLDSLKSITETMGKKKLRKALERVIRDISSGDSLSGAFARQPGVFPGMLVFFCSVGEETGTIADALKNTADHLKRVDDIVSQTRRALIYPAFVITAMGAVLLFWLLFVLPRLVNAFRQMDVALPSLTMKVVQAVAFMKEYWLLFPILAALLALGLCGLRKNERTNLFLARLTFRLPIVGTLLRYSSLTLLFSNMSLMLRSGVPLMKCLEVLEHMFRNPVLKAMLAGIRKSTGRGDTLTKAFSDTGFFDAVTLRMLSVGESTGTLERRLAYLTGAYQEKTSRYVDVMGKLIEPAAMALSGGLFIFIVISVFWPVYDLISKVSGG